MKPLLFLTHRIPFPPNKGDKVRSYHLLKFLAARYRVHLGTFVDAEEDWEHVPEVEKLCESAHFAKLNPLRGRLRSLRGLFSHEALTLPYYRDAGLQRWVSARLGSEPIRHAVAFSSAMAQYLTGVSQLKRIADLVDLDSDKWRQFAESKPWPLALTYRREARELLRFERQVAREFDSAIFVSRREAELFCSLAPEAWNKVTHAGNGVDTDYFSPDRSYINPYKAGEDVIVLTGAMDYFPNMDGARWFAHEVFAQLKKSFERLRFYIVGSHPHRQVTRLSAIPGVVVTGSVPDIRPYLAHAALVVAPLRIARGVQNKVLEAMAMAKPVVVSAQAAQALAASDGVELALADSKQAFTTHIAALLGNEAAERMGRAAREWVLRHCGWQHNLSIVGSLLEGLQAISLVPGASPDATHERASVGAGAHP